MCADGYTFSTRHLAPSEVIMDVLNKYGDSTLLHVGILRSDVPVTKRLLDKGLEVLCEHQPVLQMRIATEISKKGKLIKRFMQMDKFAPDVQMHHGADRTSWISLAESGLHTPFDSSSGPLWKMIYVMFDDTEEHGSVKTATASAAETKMWRRASQRPSYARSYKFTGALLFKIHRSIADAFSVFDLIHNQLMPILTNLQNDEDLSDFLAPLLMSPSTDDTFVSGEQLPWSERRQIRKKRGTFKKRKPDEKPPEQPPPDIQPFVSHLFTVSERNGGGSSQDGQSTSTFSMQAVMRPQTHVIPFALSDGLSDQIMVESLRNNASIQEVMLAASVMALGLISDYKYRTKEEVTCSYPVDLRQLSPHTITRQDQALGQWAGSLIQKFKPLGDVPDLDEFWEEVRKVSAQLEKDCKPWNYLTVCKEIAKSPQEANIAQLHHSYTKAQLEVSFVKGQNPAISPARKDSLPSPDVVKFCLDEHYYVRSLSDVSHVPLTLTVTALNKKVMWALAYNSKCISRTFAVKFLDTLHLLLKNAMHPSTIKMNHVKTLPPFIKSRIRDNMTSPAHALLVK